MLKIVKSNNGKSMVPTEQKVKSGKKENQHKYKYKLKVGQVIKVGGVPFKYAGNGMITGNTKLEYETY